MSERKREERGRNREESGGGEIWRDKTIGKGWKEKKRIGNGGEKDRKTKLDRLSQREKNKEKIRKFRMQK